MVQCEICSSEYQEGELELHRMICVLRLLFRCSLCNVDFMNNEGLWNHMDLHEIVDERKELYCQEIKAKDKLYQCVLCNDQRAYLESPYWQHIHDAHDGCFLQCSECGENFRSEKLKDDHAVNHCKFRSQAATSEIDDQKIPRHVELKHVSSTCPHCGKKFKKRSQCRTHVPFCERKKYSCDICGSRFKHLYTVKLHKKREHENVDDLSQIDHRSQSNDLKMEITVEETSLLLHDDQLQSISDDRSAITADAALHKNANDQVSDCSNDQSHVDNPLGLPYWCHICGISLSSYSKAKHHKMVEHTESKHQCRYCSKKFHMRARCKLHEAYCADKKEPCRLCGKRLKNRSSMAQHMRRAHNASETSGNVKLECSDYTDEQKPASVAKIDSEISTIACSEENSTLMLVQNFESPKITEKNLLPQIGKASSESPCTKCPYCGKDFSNGGFLPRHIAQNHVPCSCDICGEAFPSLMKMDYHKTTTHKEPKHKCPHCPLIFFYTPRYRNHLSTCERRNFACDICGKKFINEKCVDGHKKKNHQAFSRNINDDSDQAVITHCPVCGENFGDSRLLSRHVEATHQMTICVICGKTFASAAELVDHKITCHAEPNLVFFLCPNCGMKFNHEERYRTHVPVCERKKFPCDICGRRFKFPYLVKQHKGREHQNDNDSRNIPDQKLIQNNHAEMEITGSEENSPSQLDKPSRLPYWCHICGVSSSSYVKARKHRRTMHTEKNYQCSHCPRKFSDKVAFKVHEASCADRNAYNFNESSGNVNFEVRDYTEEQKPQDVGNLNSENSTIGSSAENSTLRLGEHSQDENASSELPSTKCPYCEKDFSNGGGFLPRHIAQNHVPCQCSLCGITLASVVKMDYHKAMMHKEPKHKCPHCPQKILSISR